MRRDIVDRVAEALGVPADDARALVETLMDAGISVAERRLTEGRGVYTHLSAEFLEFADKVAADVGIETALARAEAAAKIALGGKAIPWYARAESRASCYAPIAGFIDVVPTAFDLDPLKAPDLERLMSERPRAVLKISSESAPYYWIAGWVWDYELAEAEGFAIEVTKLRPVHTLIQECSTRIGE